MIPHGRYPLRTLDLVSGEACPVLQDGEHEPEWCVAVSGFGLPQFVVECGAGAGTFAKVMLCAAPCCNGCGYN